MSVEAIYCLSYVIFWGRLPKNSLQRPPFT